MDLFTVLIIAILALALGNRDINRLVQDRQSGLTESLRASAVGAYNTGTPGWSDVDLQPALDVAASSGANAAILDGNGHVVASSIVGARNLANASRSAITLDGKSIGTLAVQFTSRGLVESVDQLRASLLIAALVATGLAIAISVFAAVVVARRSTRPIARLTAAARAMGTGDRETRVGDLQAASKELSELAGAFDGLADALVAQENLRRDLVSDVAHELRTPVAILQANCEALLDGIVPRSPEQIASLHEEVIRLAARVEDLQSLARADAAALQLNAMRCDLAVIVGLAVDSMRARLSAAGLTLTDHLEPAVIDGDAARLHQVVTNVLVNAEKYTPAGGHIDVELTNSGPGQATLRIADTGVGISTEDQRHVFERFWRGGNAELAAGSGVGLSVVATLVEAHGGSVALESQPGVGTSVSLTFPLALPSL
ncbi:MAG TPA: ATP-binding protein [Mycobacteriales bacterium]|nr:ATP-binding protein [Mycobacteriales bacterium]